MQIEETIFPEVFIITPKVYGDSRGFFLASYNSREFNNAIGKEVNFVQDNHSKSAKDVLRGLHYQISKPQGKLIRVVHGAMYDVVVDIRRSSPNFGKWFGVELNSENKKHVWVPENFAHGFLALRQDTEVLYKTTDYYDASLEKTIRWDDPDISIEWPIENPPRLSDRDKASKFLVEAELPR